MPSPVAPTIGPTGISAPTFADILAYFTAQYQTIFGADVYLGNDSQDGQFLAILSQAFADANAAVVAVYNSFSPTTAQGAGLSSLVKINGLQRLAASASTVTLTLTGVAGTTITNGEASDASGNVWALPPTVTIPNSGTINVTATCTVLGAIQAAGSSITSIKTPAFGWQTVTNSAAAAPGAPVESDAALRLRQSQSVENPSVTMFEGIWGALEAVAGVTRVQGYENKTGSADSNGVPAHSLAFVVEGGTATAIEATIAQRIAPGIGTYGTTSGTVTDSFGSTRAISYSAPNESDIKTVLTIKALTGWSTTIEPTIQAAIAAFINALPIGGTVSYTQLFVPAYAALAQYPGTYAITAMTTAKGVGSPGTVDITVAWNEVAFCVPSDITFVIT